MPQGSPLSPIFYLFYNADLIEACKTENTEAVGYVDDVLILTISLTTQRNCKTLRAIHRIAKKWALPGGPISKLTYQQVSKLGDLDKSIS
jgi:hypothetical protein